MKRIAGAILAAAALAATPALAEEGPSSWADPSRGWIPESERGPFSQADVGRDAEAARADGARERAADAACTCGHAAAEQARPGA